MKYLKLLALALLAWAIVYAGAVTLSLRLSSPDSSSVAFDVMEHVMLPGPLQPKTSTYTYHGKKLTATPADADEYLANEGGKGLLDLLGDEHSGGYLLYLWCTKALPWVSLALTLWLLNIAAGIKRLADALE